MAEEKTTNEGESLDEEKEVKRRQTKAYVNLSKDPDIKESKEK